MKSRANKNTEKIVYNWWYSKGFSDFNWESKIYLRMRPYTAINNYYYQKILFSKCKNKRILDYGCGTGSISFKLIENGASVIGIDISKAAINKAKLRAKSEKLNNLEFLVMDGESLKFDDNYFDIICGRGILHHLKIEGAIKEIIRVLKPKGWAVFLEPMEINPLFNLMRKIIPSFETDNEKALKKRDIILLKKSFDITYFKFIHLFSIPINLFYRFKNFLNLLNKSIKFDQKLFNLCEPLGFLAWTCLAILKNSK